MKERWRIYSKKADWNGLAKHFQVDPLLIRIMINRGVSEAEIPNFLHGSFEALHRPEQMKDLEKAAELLIGSVQNHEKIAIASDFDNDGIFSAMILQKGLERIGGNTRIFTPHRILEGYGVNERIVREALEDGISVLLTCDNGIAAFEAIACARENGMKVIITDHHEVVYKDEGGVRHYRIPEADAVVNPKQEDCSYPFKGLCGAGVALKLIQRIYEKQGIPAEEWEELFEFAAIATVADVMDLVDENRIIVREGIKRLRETKNIGLAALMEAAGIQPERLDAYHIGFVLGPCFNAAGRLETVSLAFSLLTSQSAEEAGRYAEHLKELNDERKTMTKEGADRAAAIAESADWKDDRVYLIYLENCHESVAGIIAGRLREKFARPILIFTDAQDGGLKASGRSIEAYHMYDALNACRDLFTHFGGHAMAAGLSMPKENLEKLRTRLRETCTLTDEDLCPTVYIDAAMPLSYITEKLVNDLSILAPFGKGNEKPLFAGQHFRILKLAVIGKNKNVTKMQVCGSDQIPMDALYFGDAEDFQAFLESEYGAAEVEAARKGRQNSMDIALTYYPQINEYMGKIQLQIVVNNYCRVS